MAREMKRYIGHLFLICNRSLSVGVHAFRLHRWSQLSVDHSIGWWNPPRILTQIQTYTEDLNKQIISAIIFPSNYKTFQIRDTTSPHMAGRQPAHRSNKTRRLYILGCGRQRFQESLSSHRWLNCDDSWTITCEKITVHHLTQYWQKLTHRQLNLV